MASGPSIGPYARDDDLIDPDDADLNDLDDPLEQQQQPLTGNLQSETPRRNAQNYLNNTIQGEDRRAPLNTIDESVWDTLSRDLNASWQKMKLVLWPKHLLGGLLQREGGLGGAERGEASQGLTEGLRGVADRLRDTDTILQAQLSDELRDWDLWGPLVFSLLISVLLSLSVSRWRDEVFTSVFALSWVGTMLVTTQIRLLGGKIAFFQTVCIIGYTLFPLVIAALLSAVGVPKVVQIPVDVVLFLWAFAAGVSILGGSGVVKNRVGLAVYPLFLFYFGLGCLCIIS